MKPVPYSPELKVAMEQAQAEGFALGRWPAVERLVRIAEKCGASYPAVLAWSVRLGVEVDREPGASEVTLTGRLVPLDDTPLRHNRAWVVASDRDTWAVLANMNKPPHAGVWDADGRKVSPSDFRKRARAQT